MPNAKQRKNYHKRQHRQRKYGKRGKKPTFRMVRPYGIKPDPFPTRLHTRCKYIDSRQLDSGVTSGLCGVERVYRMGSIFDPDLTGTGQTVVGHADFANLYGNYIVKGAKVEINFSDPSDDGMTAWASLNQTVALQAASEVACAQQSLVYSSNINNTGSQKKTMKFYVNPWNLRGLSKLEWMANKTGHSAAMSANPTSDIYLRVAVSSAQASSKTMQCYIKIIYYVEFFNRLQLSASNF